MNRSTVNQAVKDALKMFGENGWHLPSDLKWTVTDIGRFSKIIENEAPFVKLVSDS